MKNYLTDEFIKNLEYLVNTDSGADNMSGKRKIAEFMADRYRSLGMTAQVHEFACPCVEARNHPEDEAIDLLIIGHMDTVFRTGTAAERPFTVDGGNAYGPGVADMKSGLLMGAELIGELMRLRPELRICAANNSDEEIGSGSSEQWLYELGKHTRYCLNMEPGRHDGSFVNARKGAMHLNIRMTGIAAHAGAAPEKGANAILEMARWMCHFRDNNVLDEGIRINFDVIKGGTAFNVIADYAECDIDIRYDAPEDVDAVRKCFNELAEHPFDPRVKAEINVLSTGHPMLLNENGRKLMELFYEEGEKLGYPVVLRKVGGASDASIVTIDGAGAVDACGPVSDGYHGKSEVCGLDSMNARLELLVNVCRRL